MKYIIGLFIIVCMMVGVVGAIDSVTITQPVDGQKIRLGEEVSVRILYEDFDGNCAMTSMFFVNGVPSSSIFTPIERGFYDLSVEVTDSYDGSFVSDTVTIHVIGNNK